MLAQSVKTLPAMQQTWVWSLGWEDPLEKGMATHSSTFAWRSPWPEEPGRLQSMGVQRGRHNWATSIFTTFTPCWTSHVCPGEYPVHHTSLGIPPWALSSPKFPHQEVICFLRPASDLDGAVLPPGTISFCFQMLVDLPDLSDSPRHPYITKVPQFDLWEITGKPLLLLPSMGVHAGSWRRCSDETASLCGICRWWQPSPEQKILEEALELTWISPFHTEDLECDL